MPLLLSCLFIVCIFFLFLVCQHPSLPLLVHPPTAVSLLPFNLMLCCLANLEPKLVEWDSSPVMASPCVSVGLCVRQGWEAGRAGPHSGLLLCSWWELPAPPLCVVSSREGQMHFPAQRTFLVKQTLDEGPLLRSTVMIWWLSVPLKPHSSWLLLLDSSGLF